MNNKITAIIFDWAGTTIDQGSCKPIDTFIKIFSAKKIEINGYQVYGPMEMQKITHIKKLLEIQQINDQWVTKLKSQPNEGGIQELFEIFEPTLEKSLLQHSKLIPDVAEKVKELKKKC